MMERRGWLWKKKTLEKPITVADSISCENPVETYVQVPHEKYAHLSGLEDQVKLLNDKLSAALSELKTKEDFVKQHTKVAEEAVSGWEKAESESLALKSQLESLTLIKLSADERASHLDGALKECMKEVRNVKEEGEQKLHDVVFAKTRQWEKVKSELEAKICAFEQKILQVSAENDALTRTLHERSDMLIMVNKEKSQADAEIEVLKSNVMSFEREVSSLKYEMHVIAKELEIRNEEKNMSVRSADVANKQHLEDVKKIARLESECQRLRGLVKKKLPGPATLAQMRMEVEGYGREYGDSHLRKSPAKCSSPRVGRLSDFALDNMQQCRRENELLAARLLAMEEENLMLKEALTKRNSELQVSRSMFSKTTSKLRIIEAKTQGQENSSLQYIIGSFMDNGGKVPAITSVSEDDIDEGVLAASSSVALATDIPQEKVHKIVKDSSRNHISDQMDLMDDFLEMEKLACIPAESNGTGSHLDGITDKLESGHVNGTSLANVIKDMKSLREQVDLDQTLHLTCPIGEHTKAMSSELNGMLMSKLQSKISIVFDSFGKNGDVVKCCEEIRCVLHDLEEDLPQMTDSCIIEEVRLNLDEEKSNDIVLTKVHTGEHLKQMVTNIHDFVLTVHKDIRKLQGTMCNTEIEDSSMKTLSTVVTKFLSNESGETEVLVALSHALAEIKGLDLVIASKGSYEESSTPDCIDKATLSENSVMQQEHEKDAFTDSTSNPEIPAEGLSGVTFRTCSMENFEKLEKEKDALAMDLVKSTEQLETTKHLLLETEHQVTILTSSLSDSEKTNSLIETQLKCMAESYKLLETRFSDLELELIQLRTKAELLDSELHQERQSHKVDLVKYKDLQEEMERIQKALHQSKADNNIRANQEREIAAASEKLEQCQETILLLGRQLKTMQPQVELISPIASGRQSISSNLMEDASSSASKSHGVGSPEIDNLASLLQQSEGESSSSLSREASKTQAEDTTNRPLSPVSSSKRPKHRSSWSSSSSSTIASSEKHSRGFSRFFSK